MCVCVCVCVCVRVGAVCVHECCVAMKVFNSLSKITEPIPQHNVNFLSSHCTTINPVTL